MKVTLSGPEVLTAQECFNRVAKHIFKQGERCVDDKNNCLYRKDKTPSCPTRCAIGALIPDYLYKPAMDGPTCVNDLMDRFPEISLLFRDVEVPYLANDYGLTPKQYFLKELQCCHDMYPRWYSTKAMQDTLATFAKTFSLDASVLVGLSFKDR